MALSDKEIYNHIDDQADKITSLEFKARAWGIMKRLTTFAVVGFLLAGAMVTGFPMTLAIGGAIASGVAAIACSFQEQSTWQHASDLAERYDARNFMDEVYRDRARGHAPQQNHSHNMATSQFQGQTSHFSEPEPVQMADNHHSQLQGEHVTDNNQQRSDGKSWVTATRQNQVQTQNYR